MEPAPPYAGEVPPALWHVSEDDSIERFEPRHRPGHALDEALVWAVEPGDLVARHTAAGIELRIEADLLGFWAEVVRSTLDYSGIRLRQARLSA